MTWIKIWCDILHRPKIREIIEEPEGYSLVFLWMSMLAEAGYCGQGGYLMIADNRPYTPKTLSRVTTIPQTTVERGLAIFADLGMIEWHDGAIFIRNWEKYQSQDALEARRENDRLRQKLHRQNKKNEKPALSPPDQMSRWRTDKIRVDQKRQQQNMSDCCYPKLLCRKFLIRIWTVWQNGTVLIY